MENALLVDFGSERRWSDIVNTTWRLELKIKQQKKWTSSFNKKLFSIQALISYQVHWHRGDPISKAFGFSFQCSNKSILYILTLGTQGQSRGHSVGNNLHWIIFKDCSLTTHYNCFFVQLIILKVLGECSTVLLWKITATKPKTWFWLQTDVAVWPVKCSVCCLLKYY